MIPLKVGGAVTDTAPSVVRVAHEIAVCDVTCAARE